MGEVLWESNDPNLGWDETFGSATNLVASGTYVWKVEFKVIINDERQFHTGVVNVLR